MTITITIAIAMNIDSNSNSNIITITRYLLLPWLAQQALLHRLPSRRCAAHTSRPASRVATLIGPITVARAKQRSTRSDSQRCRSDQDPIGRARCPGHAGGLGRGAESSLERAATETPFSGRRCATEA